jgi:ubiquitin C-terminal hydrolase
VENVVQKELELNVLTAQEDSHEFLVKFFTLHQKETENTVKFNELFAGDVDDNLLKRITYPKSRFQLYNIFGCYNVVLRECMNEERSYGDCTLELFITHPFDDGNTVVDVQRLFRIKESEKDFAEAHHTMNCEFFHSLKEYECWVPQNDYVIIQLKIFKNEREKRNIEFPLEQNRTFTTVGNKTYYLYGIVQHSGRTLTGGHYISTFRTNNNKWRVFNDSSFNTVQNDCTVSNFTPYLLFYKKDSPERLAEEVDTVIW